jgi:hypothetical protein
MKLLNLQRGFFVVAVLLFLGVLGLVMTTRSGKKISGVVAPSCPACPQCVAPHSEGCFFSGVSSHCQAVMPPASEIDIGGMTEKDEIGVAPLLDSDVPITFFSAPRGFDSDTTERQRAAILSWAMQPSQKKEILLFGNDPGVGDFAKEWGFKHQPDLKLGDDGIPLMDALFKVWDGFFFLLFFVL